MGRCKGQSKKKAAKKASAEVKACAGAATAAAMAKTPEMAATAAEMAKTPETDAPYEHTDDLLELVQLMHLCVNDEKKHPESIVDATHEHLMLSLGPTPDGQSRPDGYGEMSFYAITTLGASYQGLAGDEVLAYIEERIQESRLEHLDMIDRQLRTYLAYASPGDVSELCLMLHGVADDPVVEEVLAADQKVHVAPAGEKGYGVFASCDLPAGTPFTVYPCHGLWVGGHNGRDDVGRVFLSHRAFPCSELELNIRYAIDTPRCTTPCAMIIGYHLYREWFACGHIINDSHTVEELGSAEAYRKFACGNCEPKRSDMGSVVMFTTRAVTKGEELLYNYGAGRWTDPVKVSTIPGLET